MHILMGREIRRQCERNKRDPDMRVNISQVLLAFSRHVPMSCVRELTQNPSKINAKATPKKKPSIQG
jgi:hypothetical protein